MNIIQITPGAGKMFCGGCFRDNTLVAGLRKLGHSVTMVPLYLPLTLEDEDQSSGTPIFFGGVGVYLGQKSIFFRKAPRWFHRLLASPSLLKMAGGAAGKTRAQDLGELTLSMLQGEEGNQARELDELIVWLKQNEKLEVISLSNILLAGFARKLKNDLGVPIICSLQGEDFFLNGLPESFRESAWQVLAERAADIDMFIAPSVYFADLMTKRLKIPAGKMKVVHNGIDLEGFDQTQNPKLKTQALPTIGYFARMCPEKGLDTLVDAYIELRKRGHVKNVKLKVGGSLGPADEPFVKVLRGKLKKAGVARDVEFHPNLTRVQKQEFLSSLSVFSVPALYGEAFGLYVLEAWAAGVPVVQPRHGAFPELLRSGGGVLCEPNPTALASAIEELLLNPGRVRDLAEGGKRNAREKFSADRMANEVAQLFRQTILAKEKRQS